MLRTLLLSLALVSLSAVEAARAVVIWDGPSVSYTQPAADAANSANWDTLTGQVAITRATSQGLFNPLDESGYAFNASPAGTEWAFSLNNAGLPLADITASNYANLSFQPWQVAVDSSPPDSVGVPGVLHLIAEDIYLDFEFTSWRLRPGDGSGFAWTRAGAPVPELGTGLLLAAGLGGLGYSRRLARSRSRRAASTPSSFSR